MEIVLEVFVVRFDVVGDISQNIVNLVALERLGVIREDDQMRIALELSRQSASERHIPA